MVFYQNQLLWIEENPRKIKEISAFCGLTGSGLYNDLWVVLFKRAAGVQGQAITQPVDLFQCDLIKLNLAKYYRDYARKNRRSDFDAALDEFKWSRHRVEEKIKDDNYPDTRRQYGLIWMDAILNIAYIHRQRYRAAAAEKEILFFYHCLKNQLETKDSAFKNKTVEGDSFPELISWADKLLSGYKAEECKKIFNIDLPDLSEESFEICNNLNEYDRRRYFLLIMLEFGRVFRALHDVKNYARSAAMSVIADKWSCQMDRRMALDKTDGKEYEPGNNLDALIIFSNSLRKYIKYGDKNGNDFADELIITINDKDAYKFTLRKPYRSKQGINALIRKLEEFAGKGHLSSKEEVIKWCCFYLQNSKNLDILKDTLEEINIKENYLKGTELNHQLYFLKGLFYVRSGKYRKAIRIFKNLTAPENKATQYIRFATIGLKARYLLATCYMALAEYSKAEKLLEKLRDTLENARKKVLFQKIWNDRIRNRTVALKLIWDIVICRRENTRKLLISIKIYMETEKIRIIRNLI